MKEDKKLASLLRNKWVLSILSLISAGILIYASYYAYVQIKGDNFNNTPQRVIIFIGGLNTSMSNCHLDTFDNMLNQTLAQGLGLVPDQNQDHPQYIMPYKNGCQSSWSYNNAFTSAAYFSYMGGTMDATRGVWIPNNYDACTSVNNQPLANDVRTFDAMLDAYHHVFPYARFTIVGHSLGGLVALQGAYDYAINRHNNDIDKVITIDSPLAGITFNLGLGRILTTIEQKLCPLGHNGAVVNFDLNNLGMATANATKNSGFIRCQMPLNAQQAILSPCKAVALAQAGVGVMTLGNTLDTLYCNNGSTQKSAGLNPACAGQVLCSQYQAFCKFYSDLDCKPKDPKCHPLPFDLGGEHGAILQHERPAILDDILAPVVNITTPTSGAVLSHKMSGTPLSISATVHCIFGPVQHVPILLKPTSNLAGEMKNATQVLATIQGQGSGMLNIQTAVTVPMAVEGTASLTVDASGSACSYPNTRAQPTISSFNSSLPISIMGGLLAILHPHALEIRWPLPGQPPLLSIPISGNAYYLAWSPDGTQIAYSSNTTPNSAASTNLISIVNLISSTSQVAQPIPSFGGFPAPITWIQRPDGTQVIAWYQVNYSNGPNPYTTYIPQAVKQYDIQTNQIRTISQNTGAAPYGSGICGEGLGGVPITPLAYLPPQIIASPEALYLLTPMGVVDASSGRIFSPTVLPTDDLGCFGTIAAGWSHRGDTLAEPTIVAPNTSTSDASQLILYKIHNTSVSETTIASYSGHIASATWSPDDSSIATCGETLGLQTISSHGGASKTLSSMPCQEAFWSPDGSSIVDITIVSYNDPQNGPQWQEQGLALTPSIGGQTQILIDCGQQCKGNQTINAVAWQPQVVTK